MIPNDPVMLLSCINLKLRDFYPSLEAFCEDTDEDMKKNSRQTESDRLSLRRGKKSVCVISESEVEVAGR